MTSLRAAAIAARDRLFSAGVVEDDLEAQIEAELLLRHALDPSGGVTRTALYLSFEDPITADVAETYEGFLSRRLAHEPCAYITGRREFYGLDFKVTPDVLIPRPETEQLVETSIRLANAEPRRTRLRIADAGTGSGAIAVSLARALPRAEVYATDDSRAALAVAEENARRHDVVRRIAFRPGDLLTPVHAYVDLVVANLPYVTSEDWSKLAPEVRDHEPRRALDGGPDGLDAIRALLQQAPRYLTPGGHIVIEIGDEQVDPLSRFLSDALPHVRWAAERDFAGIPRIVQISV